MQKEGCVNIKQQYSLILGVALLAGAIGGLLSQYLVTPLPVLAQRDSSSPRRITAEEFRVVDSEGRTRATLGISSKGSVHLYLYGKTGNRRISLKATEPKATVTVTGDRDEAKLDSRSLKFDSHGSQ